MTAGVTEAEIVVLGSGTSMGVPMLGCNCAVCTSSDPRDNRTRPSIAICWKEDGEQQRVVIDTGPEFRVQMLREGLHTVDAVFFTHPHADHILGLDDLRPLSYRHAKAGSLMPLYADPLTSEVLERVFDYTFSPNSTYPNKARVQLHRLDKSESVNVSRVSFQRVPLFHGRLPIAGYRFGNAAYLTDMSLIPEDSFPLLAGLEIVILDALRWEHHPSHANVEEALEWAERLGAQQAYFTHMSHELGHAATEAELPAHIRLLYDGQRLPIEL